MRVAAGQAATAGAVSASVAALSEGVLTTMFLNKLRWAAAAVLAVGAITVGAAVLASHTPGGSNDVDSPQADSSERRESVALADASSAKPGEEALADDEELKLSDERDEARVDVELMTIQLQQDRVYLESMIQEIKQREQRTLLYPEGFGGGPGAPPDQPQQLLKQNILALEKAKQRLGQLKGEYLDDMKKLSHAQLRLAKLDKRLESSDQASATEAIGRRLDDMERKLDQILRRLETAKKGAQR
jgi:hypothetical protein